MKPELRSKIELMILILAILVGTPMAIFMGYDAGVAQAKSEISSK